MAKIRTLLVAGLLVLGVAGCTATHNAKVNFDKNMQVNTQNYKTFAWLTKGKILAPAVDLNPVMKIRLDDAIMEAFTAKGYQLIDNAEKADFTISYTVGNRDKIKVSSYPASYNHFGWGRGYYGGYYGGMGMATETHVSQYTEGKLAIDVYDVKSHQPAWHGWGVKRLTSNDKENPSAAIKAVVTQVVNQFN